jgi:carbon monoxide dehydrogenase subunit G
MVIQGSHTLGASRDEVWSALHDPQVLTDALPGLRELTRVGGNEYEVSIEFGAGAVRGVYDGKLALADETEHQACTIRASASGAAGLVDALARVRLEEAGRGATELHYDAEATIAGPVAGVGQRLIAATAKRTVSQFLKGIETTMTGAVDASVTSDVQERAVLSTPSARGRVAARQPTSFMLGLVTGFALAVLGIAFGRWTARR